MSLEPPVATERLPQRRHLVVKHLVGRSRRRLSPQLIHQPIALDQLVGSQDQQGQQGALSPRTNRKLDAAIADGLERAKQAKVQSCNNRNTGSLPRKDHGAAADARQADGPGTAPSGGH